VAVISGVAAIVMAQKRYKLCCLAVYRFSYPEMPYRIYEAELSSESGLVVGRNEVYATGTREEAERWVEKHCEDWVICDAL